MRSGGWDRRGRIGDLRAAAAAQGGASWIASLSTHSSSSGQNSASLERLRLAGVTLLPDAECAMR